MNEFIKTECKTCFNVIRIGFGTKIINGKRTHFDIYGCEREQCVVDGEINMFEEREHDTRL